MSAMADSVQHPSDELTVTISVNGNVDSRVLPARLSLVDYLRDELRLTGTNIGCEQGVCGACTVLLDGRSVRSCLVLAVQADGRHVQTVEGLSAQGAPLSPLQAAFSENDALQCGFCTPGFLMTATDVLTEPALDEGVLREALSGNLCRCTGYEGIIAAILQVHGDGSAVSSRAETEALPIEYGSPSLLDFDGGQEGNVDQEANVDQAGPMPATVPTRSANAPSGRRTGRRAGLVLAGVAGFAIALVAAGRLRRWLRQQDTRRGRADER
jgi:carbon-monoxide dehydrogenase small subunit